MERSEGGPLTHRLDVATATGCSMGHPSLWRHPHPNRVTRSWCSEYAGPRSHA